MKEVSFTIFNNYKKDSHYQAKCHFFITQIQNLFMFILITALMQFSNHLAVYLIYCSPMYLFLICIQWCIFWKPESDLTKWFHLFNAIMFIICLPIFFGIFFAVFHPTASLYFKQAQNCQMTGKLSNWIESTEKYSILYINFEHEGKKYLGQACASSFFQAKTTSPILPYKFYYKNDYITCGPTDGNRTAPQYHRLLPQNNENQIERNSHQRLLTSNSRSGSGSSGSSSSSSSSYNSCIANYLWSDVKIASWLCQDKVFNVEDYMKPKDCYVNFFNGDKAFMNGLLRYPLKDVYSFPLVSYQPYAYFPKIELICLILFSYYNWILSFNSIFLYTTNCILQNMKNLQKYMVFLKIIPRNNTNPTQWAQNSQYLLKLQPKINQIDQPQIDAVMNNQIQNIPQLQQMEYPIFSPNQDQQQLNSSPQINQVQNYSIGKVTEQNNIQSEDNVLKRHIEIQNPKTLNEIPAHTIAGVEDQLNMENENNIIQPDFLDHQIQKSIL